MENVEIFKECEDGKLTMKEVDEIYSACRNIDTNEIEMRFYDDRANGYVAFALGNGLTREDADNIVDRLNTICEGDDERANWFLGDESEEYVFVN